MLSLESKFRWALLADSYTNDKNTNRKYKVIENVISNLLK